mmetsp:Transcript_5592/g.23668  ORF Transcript_5592/g.23668 Transcript_5592/m.23668 type:complete len:204 (-) Transcript_5592:772-1383(-)
MVARAASSHVQRLGDGPRQRKNLERLDPLHRLRGLRTRVREEELGEALPPRAARREPLPGVPRENTVRDVRAHLERPELREEFLALDERPPGLHQVVHDHHVPPRGLALLELHEPLPAVAHLRAHHLLHALEEAVEALARALIRVRDDDVVGVRTQRKPVQQQRDAALEARQDVVSEVEALLKRVDVEDERAARPAARRGDVT